MATITIGNRPSAASANPAFDHFVEFHKHWGWDTRSVTTVAQGGWLTHIGGRLRGSATHGSGGSFGAWLPDPSNPAVPGVLLARTFFSSINPNTEGEVLEPIIWVNEQFAPGSRPNALRIPPNQPLFLGMVGNTFPHSWLQMIGTVANTNAFLRGGLTSQPANPFLHGSISVTPPPALFGIIQMSNPPVATLTSPLDGASLPNLVPTLSGTFFDADVITMGDGFQRYEVEVRVNGAASNVWSRQVLANASEQVSKIFSIVYDGLALSFDTIYQWRARVQDLTGTWSPWTAYRTFSAPDFGTLTAISPNTKIDGDSANIDFSAYWRHSNGEAMTAAKIRILDANGGVIVIGPEVLKAVAGTTVAPGNPFTISDSESGIGALAYGQVYIWQIQGRDADGEWSPWMGNMGFRTNAIPSDPAPMSPSNGEVLGVRPRLVVRSRDADAEDAPLSDVVWDFEIEQVATGTIRTAEADAYDTTWGEPSLQTNAALLPLVGQYRWRARGRDLSAGLFGISQWSPWWSFTYGLASVVTITNPTQGETQSTTSIRPTWTTSGPQESYQVLINRADNGVLVYASDRIVSTAQFHQVPSNVLTPNTPYDLSVRVWDAADARGDSLPRRFTISFGPVQGLADVAASLVMRAHDIEANTPLISWTQSNYATTAFRRYAIRRFETSKGSSTQITLAEVTNIAQTQLFDYHAPPGVALTYLVSQIAQVLVSGVLQEVESPQVSVSIAPIELTAPMIVALRDPATLRFPVIPLERTPNEEFAIRRKLFETWGAEGLPTVVTATGAAENKQLTWTLRSDQYGEVLDKLRRMRAFLKSGQQLSYRYGDEQLFMSLASRPRINGGEQAGTYVVSLNLEQIAYREGV